jgi:hypothetical protein
MSQEVTGLQAGIDLMHGGFGRLERAPLSGSRSGLGQQIDLVLDALDEREVHFLAADAGSTDPGPYFLGSGKPMTHRTGLKQSLIAILPIAVKRGIPLIIGSCGIAGTSSGLGIFRELVEEIAAEQGLSFTMALIDSEVRQEQVIAGLRSGRTRPLSGRAQLREADVESATHIVAMQGTEPVERAISGGADVVLCGRISDSAMFAAVPILHGVPLAQAWHMAKVIDHGRTNVVPVPGVATSVFGTARAEEFEVVATNPLGQVGAMKVAHATVYENDSPFRMYEPPGILDVSSAQFEQRNPRTVVVTGSRFERCPYSVKLEGAALVGYRSITICGVRDPVLISRIDEFLESCARQIRLQASLQGITSDNYQLLFRRYGMDGVMGEREPLVGEAGHELGIIGEAVAEDQETAKALMNMAHAELLHQGYQDRKHTTGNVAFPYSPSDIDCGPVYRFNIWHAMELDDPLETCAIDFVAVAGRPKSTSCD